MNIRNRLVHILAVLMAVLLIGTVARAATITLIQQYDFPGAPTATMPHKMSDEGDQVGTVIDSTGKAQAYIYKIRDVTFSSLFTAPDDTGNDTQGRGINLLRHTVGEYLNAGDGHFHGYLLKHPDILEFDVP